MHDLLESRIPAFCAVGSSVDGAGPFAVRFSPRPPCCFHQDQRFASKTGNVRFPTLSRVDYYLVSQDSRCMFSRTKGFDEMWSVLKNVSQRCTPFRRKSGDANEWMRRHYCAIHTLPRRMNEHASLQLRRSLLSVAFDLATPRPHWRPHGERGSSSAA